MIKSMTAFSRAEKTGEEITVAIEIRSYNSRYLDLILRIPQTLQPVEDRIKSMVSEKVVRGRVEVKLQVEEAGEKTFSYEIDTARAEAYHQALTRLGEHLDMNADVSLDHLTGLSGLIRPVEPEQDVEKNWTVIAPCLQEALDGLDAMRRKEGEFLARDFSTRLDSIESTIDRIETASEGLLEHYQERLKSRISSLTQGMVEIDPARIAQEAAFLADRSDISEEIVRARSHVGQFRSIMASDDSEGRKLNFLLQEFNREFNTMGAKTGNTDVSHFVVSLKTEVEKIREQVQNVE